MSTNQLQSIEEDMDQTALTDSQQQMSGITNDKPQKKEKGADKSVNMDNDNKKDKSQKTKKKKTSKKTGLNMKATQNERASLTELNKKQLSREERKMQQIERMFAIQDQKNLGQSNKGRKKVKTEQDSVNSDKNPEKNGLQTEKPNGQSLRNIDEEEEKQQNNNSTATNSNNNSSNTKSTTLREECDNIMEIENVNLQQTPQSNQNLETENCYQITKSPRLNNNNSNNVTTRTETQLLESNISLQNNSQQDPKEKEKQKEKEKEIENLLKQKEQQNYDQKKEKEKEKDKQKQKDKQEDIEDKKYDPVNHDFDLKGHYAIFFYLFNYQEEEKVKLTELEEQKQRLFQPSPNFGKNIKLEEINLNEKNVNSIYDNRIQKVQKETSQDIKLILEEIKSQFNSSQNQHRNPFQNHEFIQQTLNPQNCKVLIQKSKEKQKDSIHQNFTITTTSMSAIQKAPNPIIPSPSHQSLIAPPANPQPQQHQPQPPTPTPPPPSSKPQPPMPKEIIPEKPKQSNSIKDRIIDKEDRLEKEKSKKKERSREKSKELDSRDKEYTSSKHSRDWEDREKERDRGRDRSPDLDGKRDYKGYYQYGGFRGYKDSGSSYSRGFRDNDRYSSSGSGYHGYNNYKHNYHGYKQRSFY